MNIGPPGQDKSARENQQPPSLVLPDWRSLEIIHPVRPPRSLEPTTNNAGIIRAAIVNLSRLWICSPVERTIVGRRRAVCKHKAARRRLAPWFLSWVGFARKEVGGIQSKS